LNQATSIESLRSLYWPILISLDSISVETFQVLVRSLRSHEWTVFLPATC